MPADASPHPRRGVAFFSDCTDWRVPQVKFFPVLDQRHGVCVRAVAGHRDTYRPVDMRGLRSPSPLDTARWYREHFGLTELYVADLSAILGEPPAWESYRDLERDGFRLWLDAGLGSFASWQIHRDACNPNGGQRRLVAALESLASERDFETLAPAIVVDDGCFSVDLRHGTLWTNVAEWTGWRPERFVDRIAAVGIRRVILLDVGAVGVNSGPGALELCRYCHTSYPELELISGGGVRGLDDLRRLRDAGCTAALVATALQSERLTRDDLDKL